MRACLFALLVALPSVAQTPRTNATAPTTAYVGGQWWDGERFAPRDTTWARDGVFVDGPAAAERVVHLGERYVVPPFGDAHTHMLASAWMLDREAGQFQSDGIFYVQNLAALHSWASEARVPLTGPETIDVAHAYGGVTSTLSHPHAVIEWQALGLVGRPLADADRQRIHDSRGALGDGYWFWDSAADLAAGWDAFLAHGPDVVKVFLLDAAGEFEAFTPMTQRPGGRGLSPEVLRAVVERAHAADLQVVAHVETGADVRLAVEAGVDGLAHLPGYAFATNDDAPYRIDDATIAAAGARGLIVNPTALIAWRPDDGRPARALREGALNREHVRRLHAAGARIVLGADSYGSTAAAEAALLDERRYLDRATLLDLWTRTTPQAIFPDRAIGRLRPGFEASLLALACDPLADWACTGRIAHREKQGHTLGDDSLVATASAGLRYALRVDPDEQEVRVEGLWAGVWEAPDRWATGTEADSATVERTWATPDGLRFAYVVDLPPSERENSLLPSLNGRRLRAWLWTLLRYPPSADGPVTLAVEAPDGWRAATAFGDAAAAAVTAPTLAAALRSPVLAGDIRLVEVETSDSVSRLAVRAGHPVPDSVFALGFRRLVETTAAYVGGRETPDVLFAGIDLLEGKRSFVPGNFAATPQASAFLVLQHDLSPESPSFWGTIAHEYLHGWTPGAFARAEPEPTPVEGRLWPWFREGLTNYLGYQIAHQAGLFSDAEWAAGATKYLREFEGVEPGSPVTGARAYSEGYVVGLALDAALVTASGATLRDWFALLLERHGGDGAEPITLAAMRRAARDLGGDEVAALVARLVSADPVAVRAALAEALTGSGLTITPTDDGPLVVLGDEVTFLDPLGDPDRRRRTRARLQAAYDAAAPFEYPLVPAVPVATDRLADFTEGPDAPSGATWQAFAYGEGSEADAEVDGGALRMQGTTGPSYTGAGAALTLGTPDQTADLGAYDGIEIDIDVTEGSVVVQVTSSLLGVIDLPFVAIGKTDGRVTRRLPWSAFQQRQPVEGWERNAAAIQVLVRGQGVQTVAFSLYDLRLFQDEATSTQ